MVVSAVLMLVVHLLAVAVRVRRGEDERQAVVLVLDAEGGQILHVRMVAVYLSRDAC